MPFGHHTEAPALLPSVALRGAKLGSVVHPVLAEVIAILDLTQESLGGPDLYGTDSIPHQHVWRVGPGSPPGIRVCDLDRLLFVILNLGIKIQ
jgi:hypothetical protein